MTTVEEAYVEGLARQLREQGGVRVNIESFSSNRDAVARERSRLRAAARSAGVRVKIENVSGYFLRARVEP